MTFFTTFSVDFGIKVIAYFGEGGWDTVFQSVPIALLISANFISYKNLMSKLLF